MAPSNSYHEANIYMNEFAGDRTYRHSPWTSNPILSALVFIAIGTTLVFYIQARSLTRKMRPSVAGVPVRLPATIVWGLFSLQHSQISHVHAGTVQSDGGVVHFSLGCSPGVQYDVQSFQSLRDADSSALKYQHANASLVLSEVENLGSLQQMEDLNDGMRANCDQRAVDLKYENRTCLDCQTFHIQGDQDTNKRNEIHEALARAQLEEQIISERIVFESLRVTR
ncbi:hypothetical protein MPTK1_5g22010 [Marchantia polymorpha subsp. ruderalis]|uniref:Uncharacterized protein n=2 Tax=Marchantia polymorpha TaxID=3197 RepID=A0A176WTC0_MARPO|nr:hypothetical protein AXG93_2138s1000 [Marchantia polymorpha subsp. ruderalis]PTQ27531.1 hypothetical protein MARPO_0194s0009 [Marchantia polymorpha]BBN12676.1 hypothetical protein Mp_5g22010 [Marchantia polymorpha subsp. ruderalis]|eukprot:PTQ27531.1 hypothetical protein MARPO_0194s0009 [Marchantia polymorpha]